MKRYLIPILAVLVLTSVIDNRVMVGCAPDLPKEENDNIFTCGYEDGYSSRLGHNHRICFPFRIEFPTPA